jgi:hypothetical protein
VDAETACGTTRTPAGVEPALHGTQQIVRSGRIPEERSEEVADEPPQGVEVTVGQKHPGRAQIVDREDPVRHGWGEAVGALDDFAGLTVCAGESGRFAYR